MASKDTKKAAAVTAGVLAAAAAAGAGYYFYGDKNAKKHRQSATKWAKGMKDDVVKEAKKVKKLDQKSIARIVDRAAAVYEGARSVDRSDLRAAAGELKRNWKELQREIMPEVKKAAKSPAKKTAKKAAPKKAAAKKSTKRAK